MGKELVFFYDKNNGSFLKYELFESESDKKEKMIEHDKYFMGIKTKTKTITDSDVIKAILQKEKYNTIKGQCEMLRNEIHEATGLFARVKWDIEIIIQDSKKVFEDAFKKMEDI